MRACWIEKEGMRSKQREREGENITLTSSTSTSGGIERAITVSGLAMAVRAGGGESRGSSEWQKR